jgi:hypothetical protein
MVPSRKTDNMKNPEIDSDGTKQWYNVQGQLHREDGPALETADGKRCWFINGGHHREDGPACELDYDVDSRKSWWINGKKIK